jgi:uncharacterized repeat protein (TIGR03803 family)
MPSKAPRSISLFRPIFLAGVTTLLILLAALPLAAQTSVPATAVEAARMPQFAKRLAHSARPASPPNSARSRRGAPPDGIIYDNGPINGTTDAWAINSGFVVADSFPSDGGQISGLSFGAWLFPGDVLQSVELTITDSPLGGTTYFDGIINLTQDGCVGNQYGFNVCTASASFTGPTLNSGTYWVNLQNAQVNTGDPAYWDENSGPSLAEQNSVGTIPSEAFSLEGSGGSPQCFQPQQNVQVLYNFTQQQAGGQDGVVLDSAGNLYGANPLGGNHGAGFAFKLSHFANWVLDPLFNFLGGDTGGQPTGMIIGPNGSLYGGAQGGIQNCGSDGSAYCGLVFNLRPQPTFCSAALCSWTENVPYRFSSESDGSGVITVSAFDQQGNLYGTTSTGGAHGAGTVFELTRSGGGWTKATLYNFTGGNDGTNPTQVLLGNDGNLYGVAGGGVFRHGVVFQLAPSGGQWVERVLHPFGLAFDENPRFLVQDGPGNLYGIGDIFLPHLPVHGLIFGLEKAGSNWNYSQYVVQHGEFDDLNNLTIDAAGNLYGTGSDGSMFGACTFGNDCHNSYIFKASYAGGNWSYVDLKYLENQFLDSGGSLALDSTGKLYGTTSTCGTNNSGTVWQFSP